MKKLEKLESFQLKNEKLNSIIGGEGKPVQSFLDIDTGTQTGAGEGCIVNGQCCSYTSDVFYNNGGYTYSGVKFNDKSC